MHELVDAAGDLVADLADTLKRLVLWVRQLPVHVALPRNDRAGVVAGRDDDVSPGDSFIVERVRHMVGSVDPNLRESVEHLRVCGRPGNRTGRACLVAAVGCAREQPLGDHRAAAVRDADKEDVHQQQPAFAAG